MVLRTARIGRCCTRAMAGSGLMAALLAAAAPAHAGSTELFGIETEYQLQATYAFATRLKAPHAGIVDSPPSPEIPLPDYLKVPESANYDDGDRNFADDAIVNNRLTLLGELHFIQGDYGLLLRGDAFYDDVYHHRNDNDSPETINKTQGPHDEFSDIAEYRAGRRARVLDAYAYGSWYLGTESALNLRVGRHIAAWGESLFFSGVALAQAPADATKATVPGADVKSILLPVNQVSMQLALNYEWTLLAQYKLEFQPVELNPVGEYFSVSDVVGPGAEFIWGIENPLYLANLSDINLLSGDVPEALDLILRLLAPDLPAQDLTDLLGGALGALDPLLPDLDVPVSQIEQPNTPRYINVQRGPDIRPSDHGQWGLGVKWQVTPETTLGLYRLRYHNTTPAPVQNYGYAVLLPGTGPLPPLTTQALGLQVPVTYNIRYFDGVDLTAMSFSTTLFGANIGGEAIWRDGVDVLVDVDGGLLGPVPTPTRARVAQGLLSGLYVIGPTSMWDAFTLVGELGYVHVDDVDPACGPTSCSTELTNTRNAWGYSVLALIDYKNIYSGWDLQVPLVYAAIGDGHSAFASGLGSLMGDGDRRASIGLNFTRLQQLQIGVSLNSFLGTPDFKERPYADRDYAAFTVKYNF
ncbi:MAG: DUF1302 domain-containing protein [Gammaproteobacteria bacterium]